VKPIYSSWQIYRWPFVLSVIIAAGLLSALFGDGIWNALSWFFLAVPVLVLGKKTLGKS
jgi:hypothetical protein